VQRGEFQHDRLIQLACDIDDMTGEELGAAIQALRREAGVVDVVSLNGMGKKSRPVVRLELLTQEAEADVIAARLFDLTSTLGLRRTVVDRLTLPRETVTVCGIRCKRAQRPSGLETIKAESDDLAVAETLAARRMRAIRAEN